MVCKRFINDNIKQIMKCLLWGDNVLITLHILLIYYNNPRRRYYYPYLTDETCIEPHLSNSPSSPKVYTVKVPFKPRLFLHKAGALYYHIIPSIWCGETVLLNHTENCLNPHFSPYYQISYLLGNSIQICRRVNMIYFKQVLKRMRLYIGLIL